MFVFVWVDACVELVFVLCCLVSCEDAQFRDAFKESRQHKHPCGRPKAISTDSR